MLSPSEIECFVESNQQDQRVKETEAVFVFYLYSELLYFETVKKNNVVILCI